MEYVKVICKEVENDVPKGVVGLASDMKVSGTAGVLRVTMIDSQGIKQCIPWHNVLKIYYYHVQDKVDEPNITEEKHDIQEIQESTISDLNIDM